MTEQEFTAVENQWAELLEWLKMNCVTRGFRFRQKTDYEAEIQTNGASALYIRFDPDSRCQLAYGLKDNYPTELQGVLTAEGKAYFRKKDVTYLRISDLGKKMLDEILSQKRVS